MRLARFGFVLLSGFYSLTVQPTLFGECSPAASGCPLLTDIKGDALRQGYSS